MGGVLQEAASLVARFPHEVQVAMLEVAHAAMDQAGGAARGTGREILGLHQCDSEPAPGRVTGHPGAGDPPANHEEVEAAIAECGKAVGAAWRMGGRHHPKVTRFAAPLHPPGDSARRGLPTYL